MVHCGYSSDSRDSVVCGACAGGDTLASLGVESQRRPSISHRSSLQQVRLGCTNLS